MANGLLFFYFFWIVWIMITFFMPKTRQRTLFAVFILLCLCFPNSYIQIGVPISVTYLILLFGLIHLHTTQSRMLYHFICTFTIAVGYVAMLLWEANTPIWLFTSREILIPCTIVCMSILLTNGVYNRFICGLLGLCIGEFVFNAILYYFSFKETIGSMAFLDLISVMVILNVIIALCTLINDKIRSSITQMTYK